MFSRGYQKKSVVSKGLVVRVFFRYDVSFDLAYFPLLCLGNKYKLQLINPSRPNPVQRKKITLNFFSHFKAFIKPFEVPQRSTKIKFKLIFNLI